ncbi:MAG TPA: type II secretion system F family protein [Candidatus Hydrogenedentes bacterium]|nr:type II secretion system F family protein [Candidatus Hydrogenedentota bacterium]
MKLQDLLHIDLGALLRGKVVAGPPHPSRWETGLLSFSSHVIRGIIPVNRTRCLKIVIAQLRRIVVCNAPLVPALDAALVDAPYRNVRRALYRLRGALDAGHPLSEAMRQQKHVFPPYCIDLIRAGESTGSLGPVLANLDTLLDESDRLRRAFALPLMYFATMLILFTGITTFMCVKVFPVFIDMLSDFGASPPAFFRPLMAVMAFFDRPPALAKHLAHGRITPMELKTGAVVLLVVLLAWLWKRGTIRRTAVRAALMIPLAKRLVVKANLAHVARIMEFLAKAGYPLDEALDTTAACDIMGPFKRLLARLRDAVRRGESLGAAGHNEAALLPPWFRGTVAMGESSGELSMAFARIADAYSRDVVSAGIVASRFILPAVVLAMACWVFMVYSFPFVLLTALVDRMMGAM